MFTPGSNDVDLLDRAMRISLADSLEYILEAAGHRLVETVGPTRVALETIKGHRVPPSVFGCYYKLVLAIREADYCLARTFLSKICDTAARTPEFKADIYTEAALGDDRELFGDLIDPNPGQSPWFCQPDCSVAFAPIVSEAFRLIEAADPALASELRGLVIQVVGAAPSHGPHARPFGSASSFMLWGLIVINLERYRTPAKLVQGLVHEAAHLLLFAHSIEKPLVTNPIEERYTSPFRSDPRPMDGVFHATFVCARMHYANRKLREATSAAFRPFPAEQLDATLTDLKQRYFVGLETVRTHARMTQSGERILQETLDYMQAV